MRDFGDDVFEGTAEYYAKYRTQYTQQIFDDIVKKFKSSGKERLLDAGPAGRAKWQFRWLGFFEKVLAIDPDEGMVNEGRKKAKKARY